MKKKNSTQPKTKIASVGVTIEFYFVLIHFRAAVGFNCKNRKDAEIGWNQTKSSILLWMWQRPLHFLFTFDFFLLVCACVWEFKE